MIPADIQILINKMPGELASYMTQLMMLIDQQNERVKKLEQENEELKKRLTPSYGL